MVLYQGVFGCMHAWFFALHVSSLLRLPIKACNCLEAAFGWQLITPIWLSALML